MKPPIERLLFSGFLLLVAAWFLHRTLLLGAMARRVPIWIAGLTAVLVALQALDDALPVFGRHRLFPERRNLFSTDSLRKRAHAEEREPQARHLLALIAWVAALPLLIGWIGPLPAIPVFVGAWMRGRARASWAATATTALVMGAVCWMALRVIGAA